VTFRIDAINCLLILLSALSAWWEPFLTLVVAYTVLGPLHYLTELSWLHDRQFFLPRRSDKHILIVLCVVGFAAAQFASHDWGLSESNAHLVALWGQRIAVVSSATALIVALFLAVPIGYLSPAFLALILSISGVLACVGGAEFALFLLFGVMVPTLVHVSLFTLIFMLSGALKSRSILGGVSVVLYCMTVLLLFSASTAKSASGAYMGSQFLESFGYLSAHILALMGDTFADRGELLTAERAVAVARVIAFAYFYHYLNWFSKTSIISWHQVPAARLIFVIGVWILCVAISILDFTAGLFVSGTLSLLHVFMEFPLNWRTSEHLLRMLSGSELERA
jgi:hypothetical protein